MSIRASAKAARFTESVIREMTRVNNQYDGINLAQGMPNFPPPRELIERLRQGKVYVPAQAGLAAENFFRKENLLALRELALELARAPARVAEEEPQAFIVGVQLEGALGVRWTRWIGRYFPRLEDKDEVPQWMRNDYEREWKRPWEFHGPGYVLVQDDVHCEVLRVEFEAERIGLVQWSVPDAELAQRSGEVTARVCSLARPALQAAKDCLAAYFDPMLDGYVRELEKPLHLMKTIEARERIAQFLSGAAREARRTSGER